MKIDIDSVNSVEIREEYRAAHCHVAIYLGRYEHPEHRYSNDWHIYLYDVCGQLAIATNGNAVWEASGEDFAALVAAYGIDLNAAREEWAAEFGDHRSAEEMAAAYPRRIQWTNEEGHS